MSNTSSAEDAYAIQFMVLLTSAFMFFMFFEYSYLAGFSFAIAGVQSHAEVGGYLVDYGLYIRLGFLLFAGIAIFTIPKGEMFSKLFGDGPVVVAMALVLFLGSGWIVWNVRSFTPSLFSWAYPVGVVLYIIAGVIFAGGFSFGGKKTEEKGRPVLPRVFRTYKTEDSWNRKSKEFGNFNLLNIYRGVAIFGNAGSGKTWFWIKPLIEWAVGKGFTGLVYDFKSPEMARWVHDSFWNMRSRPVELKEDGTPKAKHSISSDHRKLWMINFSDLSRTHRVNPIHPRYLKSTMDANEAAMTILHNLSPHYKQHEDFWAQSAITFFKAIIWFLRCEYPDQCTLPHAIAMALMPFEQTIAAVSINQECKQMVELLAVAVRKKAEGQISGQVASLQSPIQKLYNYEISWVLSENDFYLDLNDAQHPGLVVIGNSPQRSESYGPILSLIATNVMKLMNDPSKKDKHRSAMIIDEAHSLFIPGYDKLGPATSRSEKVAHVFCSQSRGQVYTMYTEQTGKNILSTLGNFIQLSSLNLHDASEISSAIGSGDVTKVNTSRSKSGKKTGSSENAGREKYFHPEDIAALQPGHAIGVYAETDGKFDNRFEFKPTVEPLEHDHELQPFVMIELPDGRKVAPSSERLHEIAILKHDFIRDQVEILVRHAATVACTLGISNELSVFPEHFRGEQRIMTLLGDPIDEKGFVISRFTGLPIGKADDNDLYFDSSMVEVNPMEAYEILKGGDSLKKKRKKKDKGV